MRSLAADERISRLKRDLGLPSHFEFQVLFATLTAPGAYLSGRLIAPVPSEVATLPSSGRLLSDPSPNLLLLRLEVDKGLKVTLRSTPRGAQQPRI